jgi:phosphoribosylanthranilate isomerase
MKVKICGVKTYDEAIGAIEAGADMLGFNFYQKSPRYLSPGVCMQIVVKLQIALQSSDRGVVLVGVFVNSSPDEVSTILGDCNLDLGQLSGDESPQTVAQMGEKVFKALRPKSVQELQDSILAYPRRSAAPTFLIDAYRPGEYGGTGQQADWSMVRQLAEKFPLMLAGGLNPDNVADAVRKVQPWGVDVASGVESAPGVKDMAKVRSFVKNARQIAEENISHVDR